MVWPVAMIVENEETRTVSFFHYRTKSGKCSAGTWRAWLEQLLSQPQAKEGWMSTGIKRLSVPEMSFRCYFPIYHGVPKKVPLWGVWRRKLRWVEFSLNLNGFTMDSHALVSEDQTTT